MPGGRLGGLHTGSSQTAPTLTLNKVKDDLYEIEGDGGNVAVYVTNEGVILVDDKYEADYDGIVAKVKSITNQPIKHILSTHPALRTIHTDDLMAGADQDSG
jgi:cyclase